jgi:hypothetical protein
LRRKSARPKPTRLATSCFLSEQLGAEAYDAYRRKVPMLVSFGPRPA